MKLPSVLSHPIRTLILLWLAWAVILIGFQAFATARVQPDRPDYALSWTPGETGSRSQRDKPYLLDPFMNNQVSWDSEYYISIALRGYDDEQVRVAQARQRVPLALNYAFFPLYPHLMRVVAFPLQALGLEPVSSATLAGVIVSLLGTLLALISLYNLARAELDENGALRAAFYLLIFPSSFFLGMVYTEGLFVGLAFASLALMKRRHLFWAAVAAVAATWTRAVGIGLLIPLALAWWNEVREDGIFDTRHFAHAALALSPLGAYFVWENLLGTQFETVEQMFFSRGLLRIPQSMASWGAAFATLSSDNPQAQMYYLVEFAAIGLALAACLLMLRRDLGIALFGLFVIVVSITSGPAQGMHRYVLAIPCIFLVLARWGRNFAFDRAWTMASTLIMGLYAYLFAVDFWTG